MKTSNEKLFVTLFFVRNLVGVFALLDSAFKDLWVKELSVENVVVVLLDMWMVFGRQLK